MERVMTNQYAEVVAKYGIDKILTVELRVDGQPTFRRAILTSEVDSIIADIERACESITTMFSDIALVLQRGPGDEQAADALAKAMLEMACRTARDPKEARRHAKTGRAGIVST
jgi:hypothetical protein